MPRYFFNLAECGTLVPDVEGKDLPGEEAVLHQAIVEARGLMSAEILGGTLCLGCRIDVTDATGDTILSLPFKQAVEVRGL